MRNGSWEEFKERYREEEKSSEWTFERIRDAGNSEEEHGLLAAGSSR